jgi:hypothetical protein
VQAAPQPATSPSSPPSRSNTNCWATQHPLKGCRTQASLSGHSHPLTTSPDNSHKPSKLPPLCQHNRHLPTTPPPNIEGSCPSALLHAATEQLSGFLSRLNGMLPMQTPAIAATHSAGNVPPQHVSHCDVQNQARLGSYPLSYRTALARWASLCTPMSAACQCFAKYRAPLAVSVPLQNQAAYTHGLVPQTGSLSTPPFQPHWPAQLGRRRPCAAPRLHCSAQL